MQKDSRLNPGSSGNFILITKRLVYGQGLNYDLNEVQENSLAEVNSLQMNRFLFKTQPIQVNNMKTVSRLVLLPLLLLFFSGQTFAMRCKTKIISVGDSKHRVLQYCGKPSYVETYQRPYSFYPSNYQNVEVWIYNYGRNRLMQELYIENGTVRRIKTLGYGH